MICDIAQQVKDAGGVMLQAARTSREPRLTLSREWAPKAFLQWPRRGEKTGLPIVSELMSADKIDEFVEHVDLIQVGARNMQNFDLLKALGKIDKPVLLKRGLANTIEEWIMAAEYIMAGGNKNVILCERGIRTFEKYTRNTLDQASSRSSRNARICRSSSTRRMRPGIGRVEAMSLAAIAAGRTA